jgi:hypothetical protein
MDNKPVTGGCQHSPEVTFYPFIIPGIFCPPALFWVIIPGRNLKMKAKASWGHNLKVKIKRSLGMNVFICDNCRWNWRSACHESTRPNATWCPQYQKRG